jgi:hypothetical protein
MNYRIASLAAVVVLALAAGSTTRAVAQTSSSATKAPVGKWVAPRTPDGHPDMQGVWSYATITPLERPAEFAGKAVMTEAEAGAYEKRRLGEMNQDRRDGGAAADVARAYNDFWWDRGTKVVVTRRTSLVIDPPDGRIPPLTPEAQRQNVARAQERRLHPSDGPEDRALQDRCILWGSGGAPMLPTAYNNNVQIFQGKDEVVLLNEMIHDARIIPTVQRPALPKEVRQLMGDPHGRWEGDTLVIETRNFTDKTAFRGGSENLHLTERFTRVAEDTLIYQFTVDDPAFTKPWTVEIPLWRNRELIYEYACHEGNSAMVGILSGARADERQAEARKAGSR